MRVIEFTGRNNRIGLLARNATKGPETDLMKSFRRYVPRCLRWQKGDTAIFWEPQVETGFPDLVAVQYVPKVFQTWSHARCQLTSLDLKIMHHFFRVGATDSSSLFKTLGLRATDLLAALERLLDAQLITRSHRKWMPQPLKKVFGIVSIVAVEAKIKNWDSAFEQGHINQWFASESYILSPVEKPRQAVLERSNRTGVGIFLLNGTTVRRLRSARKHQIPASYGSWLFNEWVGRHINHCH